MLRGTTELVGQFLNNHRVGDAVVVLRVALSILFRRGDCRIGFSP